MHKSLIGLGAAASIGLAGLAVPSTANAGCYGCGVGAGLLGGLAAGAIIGSAIASNPPPPPGYYPPPPPPGYYPPPGAYYAPPPPPPGYGPPPGAYAQLAPGCHWGKRRVWDESVHDYRFRPVQVCR